MKSLKPFAFAAVTLSPLLVHAQSFDCAKARSVAEQTICGDPALSKEDSELAQRWTSASQDPAASERLKQDQRAWLRQRNGCNADAHCLNESYVQRDIELSRISPQPDRLPMIACDNGGRLTSIVSDTPTQVTFRNETGSAVSVYWLNYNGGRQQYRTVPAGRSYVQPTYVTHPWLVVGEGGQCIGLFLPTQAPSTAVIGGETASTTK